MCCGPGKIAVPLTQSGLTVTGADRSKSFLAKARRRAEAANVNVEWVQSDMRDFVRADSFDLALSMFTSLGYFDNKEEDLDVLRNVLASLKPRGAVLIELMGKETLARIYRPVTLDIADDGTRFVQRHEIFDDWTRIRNEWILIRHGRATTFTFHHTIYSGQELRNLMERVGFVEVRLYGNLQGASYDQKAERLIAVGRRKA